LQVFRHQLTIDSAPEKSQLVSKTMVISSVEVQTPFKKNEEKYKK
jgi:hypothetical protein